MKQKPNKFKITPEVRKDLITIAEALPKIPKFIEGSDGKLHPQTKKVGKRLNESEVPKEKLDKVNERPGKVRWVQTEHIPVYQNHLVELSITYQKIGKPGVTLYIDWVNSIYNAIKESYEKAESNQTTNPEPSI